MKQVSILDVVLASPGDVQAEGEALARIIGEINGGIARSNNLLLQLWRWQTDSYPGFHVDGPQGLIDKRLKIEDCDIFIGIFWKRFGTPTKKGQSGTEHEFRKAHESWTKKNNPHIMFYFNQMPHTPQSSSEAEQALQVLQFKEEFSAEGFWHDYNGEREFERDVHRHLTRYLLDHVERENTEQEEPNEVDIDEENEEPEIVFDEEISLEPDASETFDFGLIKGESISYEFTATEPVEIILFDEDDYTEWSETHEVTSYYEHSEECTMLNDTFTAPKKGVYSFVVFNPTDVEATVAVRIVTPELD